MYRSTLCKIIFTVKREDPTSRTFTNGKTLVRKIVKYNSHLLAGVALPLVGIELVQGCLGGCDEARDHLCRGVGSWLTNGQDQTETLSNQPSHYSHF